MRQPEEAMRVHRLVMPGDRGGAGEAPARVSVGMVKVKLVRSAVEETVRAPPWASAICAAM